MNATLNIEVPSVELFFNNLDNYFKVEISVVERFDIKLANGAMMYNLTEREVEKMKIWLPAGYTVIKK